MTGEAKENELVALQKILCGKVLQNAITINTVYWNTRLFYIKVPSIHVEFFKKICEIV